jgi:RNA polymerase sigma-70 factor (ECF subfamily)
LLFVGRSHLINQLVFQVCCHHLSPFRETDGQLNRAVAIAMRDGPEAGLAPIDAVLEHGELANYYLAHSARADMYRRLGRTAEARTSYEKALTLTQQEPERQFLLERIRQLK